MWPRSLRMRCWLHTRPHLPQQVPPQAWPACKALMADRRDAPTCEAGQRRQQALLAPSHDTCPEACRCLEDEAAASLTHLQGARAASPVWCGPRTWRNAPVKRSGDGPKSFRICGTRRVEVKLVFAVLIRVSARWGKKQLSAFAQHHMRALRQTFNLDHPLVSMEGLIKDRSPRRSAASAQLILQEI